jgi:outer membrane protein OmpA-like peptidoglycan-associated protein
MKKVSTKLKQVFLIGLIFALPLSFLAQEKVVVKEREKDTEVIVKKQKIGFSPYWYLQGEIGPSWSHADLSRYLFYPDLNHTSFNGSLGFGRQWSGVWSTYINLNRGFFTGEKRDVYPEGSTTPLDGKFDNDYYGGDINVGVNLSNWWGGYKDRLVTVAIHAGFGQAQWKARRYDLDTDVELGSWGYEHSPKVDQGGGISNRKVALTVPVGANINFNVSDHWDIYGDYVYTWMDTDLADGVIHGAMEVKNDVFSHFNVGARFKFGGNKTKHMADRFDEVQLVTTPIPLTEVGDSVEVTIKGTFPPKYFDRRAIMCFTPVLEYEGGEVAFETMNFKGEAVEGDGILISHANGGSFTYTAKVPYDPAMNVSELKVEPVIYEYKDVVYENCADAAVSGKAFMVEPPRKLADGVIHTSKYMRDDQIVDFAGHNYEIETISTQEADLFFQVNRSNKNLNLPLNKDQSNSDARDNTLSDMMQGWEVKNISIDGWASPEGEETFNQDLSMKRAGTTADYMENKITKSAKKNELIANDVWSGIEVVETANGPDWNGFMRAVEASDIKDKNAIINVINSAGDNAQKEEEIRNMILIYPELERDILPPLRRAVIDVNTYEPKKSPELIADLAVTGPQELDMEELHYAATLTDDNGTKRIIYANIIEIYPKYFRAYNNAAAIELEEGNLELAKEHLDVALSLKDDSYEVWNNIGIYEAITNNWVAAEEAFETSRDLGGDVDYNLGLVNIHNGEYAEAVSNLNRYSCDFNLGLAQLLNKDYSGAQKTFKCVDPQDAQSNYLIAITAARQDDKAAMLEYLGNAIKADPEVKTMAAYDREFLKYEQEADFKALVGIAQ